MPYKLLVAEKDVFGRSKFANEQGNTECVEFVRQVTGAPQTSTWKQGKKVSTATTTEIPRGTAIATFDKAMKYPTDGLGRHAAIYLDHNAQRILVLDQWNDQGEVKQRSIFFNRHKGTIRSNDAETFYVIE